MVFAMDEWARSVHVARDVLLRAAPARMPDAAERVRPVVYASWRRSRLQGLDPDDVAPVHHPETELDSHLVRVTASVVARHGAALDQAMSSLSLTDGDGRMLRRWVPDPGLASRLDALDVVPGFSVDESTIGTSSAITVLSGSPVLVRGPEHFAESFHQLTCAGAPIFHPVTRRVIGSLDVTCRLADTSPVLLSWVMGLAGEVQAALRCSASRREQLLLDAYLAHNRDARHPLVTLDQHTIITNAAAARLLGAVDQAMLWENAARAITDGATHPRALTLTDGTAVVFECSSVYDGTSAVGAVLKLKPVPAERPNRGIAAPVSALPGLVGHSPRWRRLCRQAESARGGRVLVVGEAGSGRLTVARALERSGPLRVLDAEDAAVLGDERWLTEVETEVDGPDEVLVLRHVDLLAPPLARATEGALRRRSGGRRVLATSASGPGSPGLLNPVIEGADVVLELPPLRERTEDLPQLLAAFTARACGDDHGVRWMPDAVQALSRLDWPGNLTSLEATVRRLVPRGLDGRISARDLPPELLASSSRRPLARLEHAEVRTILQALRDADGNKHRAAESLGIARSTLYRKMRALGLDLASEAY
jgi:transcriptional regulator of acetoin/glycerol metabolism